MKALKIAAVVCTAIVLAAVLALVFGIPAGFLKAAIRDRVKAETGYRMEIGSARLSFRPSLVLQLRNVSLFDDSEQPAQRRVIVDNVRIDAESAGLLSGRPKLTRVALVRPTFAVPLIRERAAVAPTAKPARGTGASASPADVALDRLTIEDGTVVFSNQRDAIDSRLRHIDVAVNVGGDDTVEIRGTARAGAQTLGLAIKGKAPGLHIDGQIVPIEFAFEAPGLLADTMPGTAELKTIGSSIAINGLAGAIGQQKFSGWATADFAGKPKVRMNVDFQRVDIAAAQPASSSPAGPPSASLDRPWSDERIDLSALNFFDAEMQFSAAELNVDTYRFAPVSTVAILTDGVMQSAVTRTAGYGGQIQGTLAINASGSEPTYALRVDMIGLQALPFLSAAANFDHIDGRMIARIDARGHGTTERAIMSSLSGAVDLRFEDGEVRGINVADMVRSLAASILNGWNESGAKKTDLSELSALFRMEGGRATTDNLRMVGPLVRVSGAGTADIGAKTLAFKLEPKLVASLEGQGSATNPLGFGVPVVVQGNWGAPKIYLELAGILDNPQAALGTLKDLGSGLLGTSPGQSNDLGGTLMKNFEGLLGPKDSGKQQAPPPSASSSPPAAQAPSQTPDTPPQGQDTASPLRDFMRDLLKR